MNGEFGSGDGVHGRDSPGPPIAAEARARLRVPYVLRRVPDSRIARVLPRPDPPRPGDVALARLEQIGRNTRLELASGRSCTLREGDLIAVAFGNRYATQQFEGEARSNGDACDLLSMGGVCGIVISRCDAVAEPSRLRLLGALGDSEGRPLSVRDFALPHSVRASAPFVVAVCGSAMDTGKTHTAASLIVGLKRRDATVASVKLTGTAAGRDLWRLVDSGAQPALDFVDGGYGSTYMCSLAELLDLNRRLVGHAGSRGADWVVMEIADGLLQRETALLLESEAFRSTVDVWVFATNDPLGAVGGLRILRGRDIEPIAISGLVSRSPLAVREVRAATGVSCFTAGELESGILNERLVERAAQRG